MLTDAQIKKLATPVKDQLIPAGDRLGLYLRLRTTGRKTWVLRRRVAGAWRVETLGDWPKLTALNARRRAGVTETPQAAATTFGEASEDFYREVILARYRSSPEETAAYFRRDCATLHRLRLDRVTRAELVRVVRAKLATPNAAAKLLALLRQFFRWATLGGLIEHDPALGLTGRALLIPPQQVRERKLNDDELRALWAMPAEPYGRLLRFALLTACRIGEAIQIAPEQIDGDLWTIPITKNGRPHTIPLTATAAALAAAGWPPRSYISLYDALKRAGVAWRPHDLRRTAATLMRAAGVSSDAIEATLNHAAPKLIRHYQQPDMLPAMRDALARLETAVLAIVGANRE
jgi:integrase